MRLLAMLLIVLGPSMARADERASPRTMDYSEGDPVPQGYHLEKKARKGLIIGGSIMFGTVWLVSAIVAAFDRRKDVKLGGVPLVGPWIAVGSGSLKDNEVGIWVGSGLLQLGGLAMLTMGIVMKKQVLVRDKVSLELSPTGVSGTFF
jgi:hypothetical protein